MAKLKGGSKVQEDKVNRPPCKWLVNHYCNHPLLIHTGVFKLCLGCKYHEVEDIVPNDDKERVPCKWLRKNRDYANQWYCKHPKSMKPDAFKSTDYCLGCSIYEPRALCYTCTHLDNTSDEEEEYCKAKQEVVGDIVGGNTKVTECKRYEPRDESSKEVTPSMKVLHCKHQSGTSDKCQKLPNCNVYPCVFEITNEWDAAKVRCKYFEQHNDGMIRDVLARISEHDLTFLESMLKDDFEWTLEQISLSLSSRYDP